MKKILVVLIALFAATPAMAYMGPGAGLGMIGSLVAVVGAVVIAVLGIFVLPIRMIMKKRRKGAETKAG